MEGQTSSEFFTHLSTTRNHYLALGLKEFSNLEDVKSEFKKKALELHPDKNPEADPIEFVRV